jgi:branched-chain amino acid transport system ATP-binding protein
VHSAIRILKREHRSLAAVIHGLQYHVGAIEKGQAKPNFTLLRAMVYYIREFPEKLHHPKEDTLLFARLAKHGGRGAELVSSLEQQHREGAAALERLDRALSRYEVEGPKALAEFSRELDAYAEFHWEHMRAEEDDLLPLAQSTLDADDWVEIDRGFETHSDPLTGIAADPAVDEFRALFKRIVELAPPPLGLGSPT